MFTLFVDISGVYYTRILDNLIVGSQPQTENDIDRLYKDEGVRAILNLQQDTDIEYWDVDLSAITKRCNELGIQYMRAPVGFCSLGFLQLFSLHIFRYFLYDFWFVR